MTLFEIADSSSETNLHPTSCEFCGDDNLESFAFHDRCSTCGHVEQHMLGVQYVSEEILEGIDLN